MSANDLDAKINYSQPTKYGRRYDRRNSDYLTKLIDATEDTYDNDALKNKQYFVGIVLRIEKLTSEDSGGGSYEPGSMPQKKYFGKTLDAEMTGIKVRVPELHYMLPNPADIGDSECQSENSTKCHHPIIDMYPTFYSRSNTIPVPDVGDLVRITYRNIENLKDPVYLGIENKLLTYTPDPSYSGASNFGGNRESPLDGVAPGSGTAATSINKAQRKVCSGLEKFANGNYQFTSKFNRSPPPGKRIFPGNFKKSGDRIKRCIGQFNIKMGGILGLRSVLKAEYRRQFGEEWRHSSQVSAGDGSGSWWIGITVGGLKYHARLVTHNNLKNGKAGHEGSEMYLLASEVGKLTQAIKSAGGGSASNVPSG